MAEHEVQRIGQHEAEERDGEELPRLDAVGRQDQPPVDRLKEDDDERVLVDQRGGENADDDPRDRERGDRREQDG